MYVIGFVYMTETHPLWIVDSGAIEHVANERGAYMEYHWISEGTKWIYVGNNSKVEAKEIGTCMMAKALSPRCVICTRDLMKLSIYHCTSEHGISCDIS